MPSAHRNAQRRIADLAEIPAFGPQIDGHPLDVVAVFRYPLVAQVHTHIGRRRTVSANHQKRIVGIEPVAQHPEHIENAGVHRSELVRMMIPQDPVDVPHRLPDVMTVGPVNRAQPFAGVNVVQ